MMKKVQSKWSGKSLNHWQPPKWQKAVREEEEPSDEHVERTVRAEVEEEEDLDNEWPAWDEPGSPGDNDDGDDEEEKGGHEKNMVTKHFFLYLDTFFSA